MRRFLSGVVVLGLMAMPAMAGVTVTPMQGTMGNPFNNGLISGFGWNAAAGGGAPCGHELVAGLLGQRNEGEPTGEEKNHH